jgi:hypothetical protein
MPQVLQVADDVAPFRTQDIAEIELDLKANG